MRLESPLLSSSVVVVVVVVATLLTCDGGDGDGGDGDGGGCRSTRDDGLVGSVTV
jgi:hypothetical protein